MAYTDTKVYNTSGVTPDEWNNMVAKLLTAIQADGSVKITGDVSANAELDLFSANSGLIRFYSNGTYLCHMTAGALSPSTSNTKDLGSSLTKWKEIFATTVTEGDHGFAEMYCVKCNKDFEVNDSLIFRVIFKTDGRPYSIPIHLECATKPKVKFTRQEAVKETIYIFNDKKGKVEPYIQNKTEKKKYLKKRLKKGYKINQKTGEICDGKKKCTKSQALEVYEEVEDEVVYHDVEYEV